MVSVTIVEQVKLYWLYVIKKRDFISNYLSPVFLRIRFQYSNLGCSMNKKLNSNELPKYRYVHYNQGLPNPVIQLSMPVLETL